MTDSAQSLRDQLQRLSDAARPEPRARCGAEYRGGACTRRLGHLGSHNVSTYREKMQEEQAFRDACVNYVRAHVLAPAVGGEAAAPDDVAALRAQVAAAEQRVRDLHAEKWRDGPLLTCPWCGVDQRGRIANAQISHLIECGDRRQAAPPESGQSLRDQLQADLAHSEENERLLATHAVRLETAVEALRPLFDLCRAHYDGTNLMIERRAQHQDEPEAGEILRAAYRALAAYDRAALPASGGAAAAPHASLSAAAPTAPGDAAPRERSRLEGDTRGEAAPRGLRSTT